MSFFDQFTPEEKSVVDAFSNQLETYSPQLFSPSSSSRKPDLWTVAHEAGINLREYSKDGIVLQALWIYYMRKLRTNTPVSALKYPTLEEFMTAYGNDAFGHTSDREINLLHETANWMSEFFKMIPAYKNKGLAIAVIPKLIEGWDVKYITGSGQKLVTKNRVHIFETEGHTKPNSRRQAWKHPGGGNNNGEGGVTTATTASQRKPKQSRKQKHHDDYDEEEEGEGGEEFAERRASVNRYRFPQEDDNDEEYGVRKQQQAKTKRSRHHAHNSTDFQEGTHSHNLRAPHYNNNHSLRQVSEDNGAELLLMMTGAVLPPPPLPRKRETTDDLFFQAVSLFRDTSTKVPLNRGFSCASTFSDGGNSGDTKTATGIIDFDPDKYFEDPNTPRAHFDVLIKKDNDIMDDVPTTTTAAAAIVNAMSAKTFLSATGL